MASVSSFEISSAYSIVYRCTSVFNNDLSMQLGDKADLVPGTYLADIASTLNQYISKMTLFSECHLLAKHNAFNSEVSLVILS